MNWRTIGKWTGITTAGVAVFALLITLGIFLGLRSPGFTQTLVAKLGPVLDDAGIKFQRLGYARIDLLGSIHIRDIDVQWHDAELGEMRISADNIDIEFSPLSLIFTPTIHHAILENASISGRIVSSEPVSADDEPYGADAIEALLDSPPLLIDARAVRINHLAVDLRLENGSVWQRMSAVIDEAGGELEWRPGDVRGAMRMVVSEDAEQPWLIVDGTAEDALEIRFVPSSTTDVAWHITKHDSWRVKTLEFDHHTVLRQPTVTIRTDTEHQKVGVLDDFELKLQGHAASAASDTATGPSALFPLNLDTTVKTTAKLDIDGLRHQGLALSARADHDLHLEINGEVDPFSPSPPQLHLKGDQRFSVDHLDAYYEGQRITLKKLSWHLLAAADTPKDAPGKFEFKLDSNADRIAFSDAAPQPADRLAASFRPAMHLSAAGQVGSLAELAKSLSLGITSRLTLDDTSIRVGEGRSTAHYAVAQQRFSGEGEFRDSRFEWIGALDLDRIAVPELTKAFNLRNQIKITSDAQLSRPSMNVKTALDEHSLAQLEINAENDATTLNVQHSVRFALPLGLSRYDPALAETLDLIGETALQWNGTMRLQHGSDKLQNADFTSIDQWPLRGEGHIALGQSSRPADKDGIALAGPIDVNYSLTTGEEYRVMMQAAAPGIMAPPMTQPLPLQFNSDIRVNRALTSATTQGVLRLADRDAVHFRIAAADQPRHFTIDAELSSVGNIDWRRFAPAMDELRSLGLLDVEMKFAADIRHPSDSITTFDTDALNEAEAQITSSARIQQRAGDAGDGWRLAKPISFSQRLDYAQNQLKWNGAFDLSGAELVRQVAIDKFSGAFRLNANINKTLADAELTLHVDDGNIRLLSPTPDVDEIQLGQILTPLALNVVAKRENNNAVLERLDLNVGQDVFLLRADGNATLDGNNIQLESVVKTDLRPDLFSTSAFFGNGSLVLPLRVTMIGGEQVTVEGELHFADMDITLAPYKIQNLNGSLKMEEELLLTPQNTLKFRYLVSADPFQRVDFNRIQPFLDDRQVMNVTEIHAAGNIIGPVLASTRLKQNMLRLQHFDMALLGGHVTGQMYLDATPGAWKIGLLSRVSQIDARQLLAKDSPQGQGTYAPISARSAVEFDVEKRLLEGRIDITKISREQLLQLLEIVDPDYQDEQLASVRSALRLAYPRAVSITMSRGLMDLEVAISALPNPIQVRALPLTPLIEYFAGETLGALDQVPLE